MYIKKNYSFLMTLNWSKKSFILGILYALIIQGAFYLLHFKFSLPWQPISIIGIAVAFYLGFKNNSSYDRTWEARKIWGGIVNNSRSFGVSVDSFLQGENQEEIKKELIYRHIAWLTALRYQLRLSRPWEHSENRLNTIYSPTVCEKYISELNGKLVPYLNESETERVMSKTNVAAQIMAIQAKRLQELKDLNYFEDFRHMEFHTLTKGFYDDQGAAERIKNFPFPRQYASTALWLTLVFAAFVPLGLLDVFGTYDSWIYWLSPFFSGLIIWVFFLMEKIGDYSENPFEGTYNDVPITSIAIGIEIDLREMINDSNIPDPIKDTNGFLM
ncbi:MAG: bestrophin family ion channel [Crocinitomicaceae bacterium]